MNIRDRVRSQGIFSRLHRIPRKGWVAGVCAGLAEFFDLNVKLIRVLFIAALIISGFFPFGLLYVLLWYLMEEAEPEGTANDRRPPQTPYAPRSSGSYSSASMAASPTELRARFARLEARLANMEDCVTSNEYDLRREFRKLES